MYDFVLCFFIICCKKNRADAVKKIKREQASLIESDKQEECRGNAGSTTLKTAM
jgi:hypothetical protein